jgi:hypothetical protein
MSKLHSDSLFAYLLIGILSSVPFFIIYALIVVIAVLNRWPEWLGPIVGSLSWIGIAFGGSFLSGWICGHFFAHRGGIAPLLLANSAGWIVLVFIGVGFVSGLFAVEFSIVIVVLLMIFVVYAIGLLITWWAMRLGREK